MKPDHEAIEELVADQKAPVYIVHPSQKQAVERAQSMTSMKLVSTEERHAIAAEIAGFRFAKGFGSTVRKFITAGIGIHHAGMLPKYRRLIELSPSRANSRSSAAPTPSASGSTCQFEPSCSHP